MVTQDLDHAEVLAVTGAGSPSVLLVRDADVLGPRVASTVRDALVRCESALATGAVVVVSVRGLRLRVLPVR